MLNFLKGKKKIIPNFDKYNRIQDINNKFKLNINNEDNKNNKFILDIFNEKIDIENIVADEIKIDLSVIYFTIGLFYQYVKKDNELMKKNYVLAIDNQSINAMFKIGFYHQYDDKDYENMKKYYLMAIFKNCNESMYQLAEYYKDVENSRELSNQYYLNAFINGNTLAENKLDENYNVYELYNKLFLIENKSEMVKTKLNKLKKNKKNINNINELLKHYSCSIKSQYNDLIPIIIAVFNDEFYFSEDEQDPYILHIVGLYYELKIKNYDKMKKCYNKVIDYYQNVILDTNSETDKQKIYNLTSVYSNFGVYYEQIEKNYDEAKKNYWKAISLKDTDAMIMLSVYYLKIENNKEEMKKILIMAIENNHVQSMDLLIKQFDIIHVYNTLKLCENKNELINNKLKSLENTSKKIKIYSNKVKLFERLNNYKDCIICFENKLNIDLDCGHEVCSECYCDVTKCPLRCV